MESGPVVSVVVATHNRAERLERMLEGLRAQTLPAGRFEAIVVDDGSSDSTPAVLRRELAGTTLNLTVLRHEQGRGPAAARNSGWRAARAPVVAFTDDDCVPAADWLERLLGRADGDTIVKGRTVPEPGEAHLLGPYSKTVQITHSSPHYETCNIAYPRAVLERIGGFDESYPSPAGEDSDLGCRAVAAGGRALFAPEALVHHAVFERGPLGAFKDALLATEGVQPYKRNPALRSHLAGRVFYNRSHPMLLQAALALWLARRRPAALALCLPYAHNLRARCRANRGSARHVPFFVAFDALQIAATIRGAIRNRVFII
jgi:glycosyltransferase involved in cell wall biosynthesis